LYSGVTTRSASAAAMRSRRARLDRDVVRQEEAAARKWGVPVEPEVRAIDLAGELERDPLVPQRIGARAEEAASELDGLRGFLDRQVAPYDELVAVRLDRRGREADLGMAGDVEEVGRLEMCVTRLVERDDAGDVDRPLDGRLLPTLNRPGEAGHTSLYVDEPELLDLELEG
jgi:hypothetical protein